MDSQSPNFSPPMASIFLCHASEDKPTVEPIQLALAGMGHQVFYDEQSLPPGGDYHERIQAAIASCDLFVFIGSQASIKPGKFTLSELKFARQRWPTPVGRVLPVALADVEPKSLPAYLQAATVLKVDGNAAAEVRGAAEKLLAALRRRKLRLGGGVVAAFALASALLGLAYLRHQGPPAVAAVEPAKPVWAPMTGQLKLESQPGDFIGDGKAHLLSSQNGLITANASAGAVSISFEGDDHWSAEFAAPRGQPLAAGTYAAAQRAPFNNPLKPGMSVSGAGRGCNELEGEFAIERIVVDPASRLRDLKLSFRQRCDGGRAELLGTIEVAANDASPSK